MNWKQALSIGITIILLWLVTWVAVSINYEKKIESAFEKGVAIGKRSMQPHRTDTIILERDKALISSWVKVDSIEVLLIHYNQSEVK